MMIKVISFDIGGTLIEVDENIQNDLSLKSLANLIDLPYESVRKVYKDVFQKCKGTFNELVNEFCSRLKINREDKIIDFFHKKFLKIKNSKGISNEKVEIIKALKENGYQVILFSNNCCLVENDSVKVLEDFIDGIFYSYDLGYTKSDPKSYRYIENKLGRKPEEFLHIGDTISSDYVSPIKNGWNAIYYGQVENKEIESVQNLKEILEILNYKNQESDVLKKQL